MYVAGSARGANRLQSARKSGEGTSLLALSINGLKLRAASALPLIPAVEGRPAGGQKLEG